MNHVITWAALAALLCQDVDVRELIKGLTADELETREAAASRLLEAGEKARPILEEASRSGNAELAARAIELLRRLDHRARVKRVESLSGKLGDTGVVWIKRDVFDLLAEEENLPPSLKSLLVEAEELTLALVAFDESGADSSEITDVVIRAGEGRAARRAAQEIHREDYFGEGGGRSSSHGYGKWWKDVRKTQGTELFRLWPRLRRSSIVLACVSKDYNTLLDGLEAALGNECVEVRAAAAALLKYYFTSRAVGLAIRALGDKEKIVAQTARATLRALTGVSEGGAEEIGKWWAGLDDSGRSQLLRDQWKARKLADRCCDDR